MKHSRQLFTHYVTIWARLLQQSASSANPATYLLEHDARTPVFYLEAMSRVLMHAHNPKKMRRLNEWFKTIEDALGQMDYYTGLLKDMKSNRKIPASFKHTWTEQLASATEHLNTLLTELGWLGERANRILDVHKILKSTDWLKDKAMRRALKARYQSDLTSLIEQMSRPLKHIEQGVHELRRDVRWLSIYPQAYKGFMLLQASEQPAQNLLKYATPDVINSRFNQLPAVDGIEHTLKFNTHAYYAMSWLITQLGGLKDSGLKLLAVSEQMQIQDSLNPKTALENAQKALGSSQPSIDDLLNTARGLIKQIQADQVFEQLLSPKPSKKSARTPAVKTPVNTVIEPAVELVVKPLVKPTAKPVARPNAKPAVKSVTKPTTKTTNKSSNKTTTN